MLPVYIPEIFEPSRAQFEGSAQKAQTVNCSRPPGRAAPVGSPRRPGSDSMLMYVNAVLWGKGQSESEATTGSAMSDRYLAKPLVERQVDQAFPVVQAIQPGTSIEAWRAFARRLIAEPERGGVMTVQAAGYIYGLFSYRVEPSLQYGDVLVVENFAVLDLFSPAAAASALVKAMDELAKRRGCGAIHTGLPSGDRLTPDYRRWMIGRFRDLGHHLESITLCKSPDRHPPMTAANLNTYPPGSVHNRTR